MHTVWRIAIGVGGGLLLAWILLAVVLVAARPERGSVGEALRLLPDTLTLFRRLAIDRSLPRAVRVRLWLLFAYLAFPIDLIPDFIPVLGYLDDLVLVPLGVALVVRLTPPAVIESARLQAQEASSKPVSYTGAAIIVAIWLLLIGAIAAWGFRVLHA